jgi:hypothetical protein
VLGPGNNGDGGAGKERARSTSPGRKAIGGTNGAGGPGSTSSDEHGRPPLLARRLENSNPSPMSSSLRSLDQIAGATILPLIPVQILPMGYHPSLFLADLACSRTEMTKRLQ